MRRPRRLSHQRSHQGRAAQADYLRRHVLASGQARNTRVSIVFMPRGSGRYALVVSLRRIRVFGWRGHDHGHQLIHSGRGAQAARVDVSRRRQPTRLPTYNASRGSLNERTSWIRSSCCRISASFTSSDSRRASISLQAHVSVRYRAWQGSMAVLRCTNLSWNKPSASHSMLTLNAQGGVYHHLLQSSSDLHDETQRSTAQHERAQRESLRDVRCMFCTRRKMILESL